MFGTTSSAGRQGTAKSDQGKQEVRALAEDDAHSSSFLRTGTSSFFYDLHVESQWIGEDQRGRAIRAYDNPPA
jgi:hypothetical protein